MFKLQGTSIILDGTRPGFSTAVTSTFRTNAAQDICHSFSISLIEKWMLEMLSKCTNTAILKTELSALALSLHPSLTTLPAAITAKIDTVCTAVGANPVNQANICTALNDLLKIFNNVTDNLRIGDSSWNRRISKDFDPESWVHVNAAGTIDSSMNGSGSTTWTGMPILPTNIKPAFFLCSTKDSIRISRAYDNIKHVTTPLTMAANKGTLKSGASLQFIHSSSNQLDVPTQTLYPADKIYFYYATRRTWIAIG